MPSNMLSSHDEVKENRNVNGNSDESIFVALLKDCARKKDVYKGSKLHADITKRGLLGKSSHLASTLISMYAKGGAFPKAQEVLEELTVRNVASWNALIAGCAQHGKGEEGLNYFDRMQSEGISPNAITFICISKVCGNTGAEHEGKQIHDKILCRGLLEKDVMVGTALVDMYAKCGALAKAQEVLEKLPLRNVVSWNALITGYTQQGRAHEALNCFEQMQSEVFPDVVTFICTLKACGRIGAIDKGEEIHNLVMARGLLEKDIALGCALVGMYTKCGALAKAQKLLEELPIRNLISWSALISGYAEQGRGYDALHCFEQMQSEGICPDAVTYICLLKSCGNTGAVHKGKQIHYEIVKKGLLRKDVVLGTALVDMYAKCGMLVQAQQVLEELPVRDAYSWCALIAGFAQEGQGHAALDCYEQMQVEGCSPDIVTYICLLKACGSAGATDMGEKLHEEIVKKRLLEKEIVLGTAVVDMYAKCGLIGKAELVLEELAIRNVVSWSAVIAGYAQQGQGREALTCFERMQNEGHSPNAVTFISVLSACSHSGLLDEAQMLFRNMKEKYSISPNSEHHACMVAVFCCAGLFDKALSVIKVMPSYDYPIVWLALLGGCRKWENVKLGKLTFDQAVQLDNSCAAAYILMANIFAAAGMQKDADKVEAMRLKHAVTENHGSSLWVDTSGKVHSFSRGNTNHARRKDILMKLKEVSQEMTREGYPEAAHWLSQSISGVLCGHSDKLAIAYALINTYDEETIHIVSNMHMCGDCHIAISLISKLEKRRIMIRDVNCLHVFETGTCACGTFKTTHHRTVKRGS